MSASLIAPLVISGSRKSDGTANASGKVWAFLPGTSSTATLYADADGTAVVTQPVVLDEGGRVPAATAPDGLFTDIPIRLYIENADGGSVSDVEFVPATASTVTVNSDAMTGATLDDVLTAAQESFGGTDFSYLIATGQTELPVKTAITSIAVNVKAFGAKGDEINIDTTAIQRAVNYVKAAGGGTVLFPPGTYLIDQEIALSSASGVSFVGLGAEATTIKSNHATANLFTLTTCTGVKFIGLNLTHASTSTGAGIACTTVIGLSVERVNISAANYRYGVTLAGLSAYPTFIDCNFTQIAGDAAARGILVNATNLTMSVRGGTINNSAGYSVEFDGAASNATFVGANLQAAVRFAASLTGTSFAFIGCWNTTFSVATATIPVIRVVGGDPIASATSSATGASQTPSLIAGQTVLLTAASGGAGTVTVNAPSVIPPTGASSEGLYWDFIFKNAAGGAVTWTLNPVYFTAGAIPTTDAHTIAVRFRWDRTTSKLREVSRADTVT